jgi:uncharacterized membrane protein
MNPQRRAYLDWVRGLAVLIMVEAHVLDSWTAAGDRARPAFGYAMILGGFGAPLFLFLAGIALTLSAESKFVRTGDLRDSWQAVQKRGWQVFGLALLFRLQSYILSGGFSAVSLLKVDILNIMGPSIAAAALTGERVDDKKTRGLVFGAVAVAIAMVTPLVRTTGLLDVLPDPVEWYFRPTPGRTNFTLFPWAGFVFAGALVGTLIAAVGWRMALAGGFLAGVAYAASFRPSIYPRSEFWTSSPAFFFIRVGVLVLLVTVAYWWARAPWRHKVSRWSFLEEFGRSSLFVYWIHVEMVYGFFSRPWRRSLSLEMALVAYVLFTLFLLGLVILKNRLVEGRGASHVPQPRHSAASI